jgi:hypothetical protein
MEQRRLRLGDILDDYCPRERRVTNHVVVAMIEDEIRQTRCTTCDAEHAYKGGKAPRRRKAAQPVIVPPATGSVVARPHLEEAEHEAEPAPEAEIEADALHDEVHADEPAPAPEPLQAAAPPAVADDVLADEGPVHRPLIRATLPRPEGIKTERPVPEFTIRQNPRGNGNFRGGFSSKGGGGRGVNGGGRPGNGPRFGRGPQQGRGQGGGRGGVTPGGFGRGPKKRSR